MRDRLQLLLSAVIAAVILTLSPVPSHAQLFGGPTYLTNSVLNDTCAIAMQDSSLISDMSSYRYATVRVQINPPKGAAEPWALVRLRFIACTGANPDSTNASLLQLQPIADHSYIGAAAGDTLGYGTWTTANAITVGNGEITIRAARINSKWAYPSGRYTFGFDNKGQVPHVRYFYIQSSVLAAGGTDATRVRIDVTKSN